MYFYWTQTCSSTPQVHKMSLVLFSLFTFWMKISVTVLSGSYSIVLFISFWHGILYVITRQELGFFFRKAPSAPASKPTWCDLHTPESYTVASLTPKRQAAQWYPKTLYPFWYAACPLLGEKKPFGRMGRTESWWASIYGGRRALLLITGVYGRSANQTIYFCSVIVVVEF